MQIRCGTAPPIKIVILSGNQPTNIETYHVLCFAPRTGPGTQYEPEPVRRAVEHFLFNGSHNTVYFAIFPMMKIITYPQYKRILEALADHIDNQNNPYRYLFFLINGYEYGNSGAHTMPKKLIGLSKIKIIWDTRGKYMRLVRLAVLRHYEGCIVATSENESFLVTLDMLRREACKILKTLKEEAS